MNWEYRVELVGNPTTRAFVVMLNMIGSSGWELVEIINGMGIFKREMSEQNDQLCDATDVDKKDES